MNNTNKRKFGKQGEGIAEQYLKSKGYEIICKNFYTRRGEIDIVAQEKNFIVFVEVKTRTNCKYGTPAMAVNSKKIRHMKTAARIFLLLNQYKHYDVRFDVIEIYVKKGKYQINHIQQII